MEIETQSRREFAQGIGLGLASKDRLHERAGKATRHRDKLIGAVLMDVQPFANRLGKDREPSRDQSGIGPRGAHRG